MSKAYKVSPRVIQFGARRGETVYTVIPVNYGTLTSNDVARQIAAESTACPGDVKNVLDRYAYYVVENLKKGYAIELLGFGKLYLRFNTAPSVTDEKKATAALIKGLVPAFRPSFTIVNGNRIYDLVPDKIQLVKYNGLNGTADEESGESGEEINP
jgi:putative DNA-binding protein